MNILMILESEFPPDVRVEKEIRTLTQAGHKIYLIATSTKKKIPEEQSNGLDIHRMHKSKLMTKFSALALSFPFYFNFWKRHIERFLSKHQIDVIHLHDLPLASVVFKLGKKHGIPAVFDFHENRPEIMKLYAHTNTTIGKLLISYKKWENYQAKYSKLADRLILVTPEAKIYYTKKYQVNAEKTFVVPNFADVEHLKSIQPEQEIKNKYSKKFMLVYFGDTGLRRGTMTIVEAANLLKDRSEVHFVIIGNSKQQYLLSEKAKTYGLTNIEFTGFLNFKEIVSYISASRAGLCPFLRNIHHDTTYANKLFQFLYFGKPVIASDCPAQKTIINESNAGLIHVADDHHDLAKKIIELKDHTDYNQLSQNAKKAVLSKYNTLIGNESLIDLYNSIKK
jgi:glycosyltransferase involved in cell wall biosynthesis